MGVAARRAPGGVTSKTRAIVINTPMNPIGKIFGDDDLSFIADLIIKHDLVAIADEVYEHLTFDGRKHKTLFAFPDVRDRVVRIGSAGKTFSVTGWKVGYVTADAKLMAPISRAHQFVTFTTPPALQTAVAFGLRLPDAYFDGLKAALQARRDFVVEGLEKIGFAVDRVDADLLCGRRTRRPSTLMSTTSPSAAASPWRRPSPRSRSRPSIAKAASRTASAFASPSAARRWKRR